jgi:hypothetical protein
MHVPFLATSPFGEGWGEVGDVLSGVFFLYLQNILLEINKIVYFVVSLLKII